MLVDFVFSLLKNIYKSTTGPCTPPHHVHSLNYEEMLKETCIVLGAGAWPIGMSIILEIAVLFHVQNLIILSSPSLCFSQTEGLETSHLNIRSCHLCKHPAHLEMRTSAV